MNKIKELGQVFTLPDEVEFMLSLRKNQGRVLEPAAGEGAFFNNIPDCVGIELDPDICPTGCYNMDFFDYPTTEKFPTVITNPPYVKGKLIYPETRAKLTSSIIPLKSNLYLHYMEKGFHHLTEDGELIYINPMDFLNSFGSKKLVDFLLAHGTFTHIFDRSGENIFRNANPDSCCIWRYERGNFNRTCMTNQGPKMLLHYNGRVFVTNKEYTVSFSDVFYIKVGAVPGKGETYFDPSGEPFVYSKTRTTGRTRGMRYLPSEWVRSKPSQEDRDNPRIYVNCKTLQKDPFFTHQCPDWDGSVLAIFPKDPSVDLTEATTMLNCVDWNDLGFMWHGKYVFTSGGLTNCLLPPEFEKLIAEDVFDE